jgi:hypothetical protein
MFAAFKTYGIHNGGGTEELYTTHFTKQDCSNLMECPFSLEGRAARRKLILAVTEDSTSFRELQKQLRERRLVTNDAVCLTVMGADDPVLLHKMGCVVRERGVELPKEKQIEFKVYGSGGSKSGSHRKTATIGALTRSTSAFLKGLQGRVNRKRDATLSASAIASQNAQLQQINATGAEGRRASSAQSFQMYARSTPVMARTSSVNASFFAASFKPASKSQILKRGSVFSGMFNAGDLRPTSPGKVLQETMSIVTGVKKTKGAFRAGGGRPPTLPHPMPFTGMPPRRPTTNSLHQPVPALQVYLRPGLQSSWCTTKNISSKSLSKDLRYNLRVLEREKSQRDMSRLTKKGNQTEKEDTVGLLSASMCCGGCAWRAGEERDGYSDNSGSTNGKDIIPEEEEHLLILDFVPQKINERIMEDTEIESGREKLGALPNDLCPNVCYDWSDDLVYGNCDNNACVKYSNFYNQPSISHNS